MKSSHQLSKYDWINFSSKQRSFYFTKSSRGPDLNWQRASFGPRAVCLTSLLYTKSNFVFGSQPPNALMYFLNRCIWKVIAELHYNNRYGVIHAYAPFVQAGAETSDTGAEAVEPYPGFSWDGHSGRVGTGVWN